MLLAETGRVYRALIDKELSSIGLRVGQEFVLFQLSQSDGQAMSELARNLDLQPPTITKVVRRMAEAGLVERRTDPRSARSAQAFLTEAGRANLECIPAVFDRVSLIVTGGLDEMEQAAMRRLLLKVRLSLRNALGRSEAKGVAQQERRGLYGPRDQTGPAPKAGPRTLSQRRAPIVSGM
jgi:DNA-binding MarR family transcriptional regulator